MKSTYSLPAGFRPVLSLDLQHDKRLALTVNGIALAIAAVMLVWGGLTHSMRAAAEGGAAWLRLLVLLGGMVAYIILHEAVHGIVMKLLCPGPVRFGFTGAYAYAGSDAYYNKRDYILIALAPVVFWGIVLGILNAAVPEAWFWPVYLIQLTNLSGAGGDLYVTWRMSRLPGGILVRDAGTAMTVYAKSN